jgi:DNA-binding transcriptional LysR family regulator
MIETALLKTLVTVADSGSYSKAAIALNVSQSAVSQSIKNLENKIETQIFQRTGHKMLLTHEGQKLFNWAEKYLTELDSIIEDIKHDKSEMSGKLKLGTLAGMGKSWILEMLIGFIKDFPDIGLSVCMGLPQDLARDFDNGKYDGLIVPEYCLPHSGEKIFLGEEYATLVFPKSGNFKIDKNIDLEELCSYPVILFEEDGPIFGCWCQEHFGRRAKKIKKRFVVNSHRSILQAVSEGLGIAVVPTHVLERSFYRAQVNTLAKKYEVLFQSFYLVCHKELKDLKRGQVLIDRIIKENII